MDKYWNLPVAFYFRVKVGGTVVPFKEVSGLSAEMEVESIHQGGDNDTEYKLPKHLKHSNLVLKRAVILLDTPFITWIKDTLYGNFSKPISLKDIEVTLLNHKGEPVSGWMCQKAYPVKWETEALDAEKNSILVDSVEFAYRNLKKM